LPRKSPDDAKQPKPPPSRQWEWVSPSAARVVEPPPEPDAGESRRKRPGVVWPVLTKVTSAVGKRVAVRASRFLARRRS